MDERNYHFDFDFTPIGQAIRKAREPPLRFAGTSSPRLQCRLQGFPLKMRLPHGNPKALLAGIVYSRHRLRTAFGVGSLTCRKQNLSDTIYGIIFTSFPAHDWMFLWLFPHIRAKNNRTILIPENHPAM